MMKNCGTSWPGISGKRAESPGIAAARSPCGIRPLTSSASLFFDPLRETGPFSCPSGKSASSMNVCSDSCPAFFPHFIDHNAHARQSDDLPVRRGRMGNEARPRMWGMASWPPFMGFIIAECRSPPGEPRNGSSPSFPCPVGRCSSSPVCESGFTCSVPPPLSYEKSYPRRTCP